MASPSRLSISRAVAVAALAMLPFQQVQAQGAGEPIFHHYRVLEPSVRKAGKEVEAHRFDDANRLLEPVLKEVPDHAEAHFLLALMAYEGRDFAGALNHIETSERSLEDLNQRYARVLAKMKDDDDEDARVTQDSLNHLVDAGYDSINDILDDKRQHLKDLEAKNGGLLNRDAAFAVPSAYSFLYGNCLYRLGRASEAAAQYQLAVHSDPTNAKAWNNLVNLYWEAKDFDQARAALAKAEAAGAAIQPKLKQRVLEAK
ncbi:MAG TPA: tetratricopeptide repeat protein [Holophagaceae bacterium]|nr:tetratricopeptide repeat protein [Holophagaceae bacterium]